MSLKLLSNSWGNSYISCLLLIITLPFTCVEKNLVKYQKVLKYYFDDWNSNMKNSIAVFIFCLFVCFVFFQAELYSFWNQKTNIIWGSWHLESRLILVCRIRWLFWFFFSSEIPFCVNLVQKCKRVNLRRNLVPSLEFLMEVTPAN